MQKIAPKITASANNTPQAKSAYPDVQMGLPKLMACIHALINKYYHKAAKDEVLGPRFPTQWEACHTMCRSSQVIPLPKWRERTCTDGKTRLISQGNCLCLNHISLQSKERNEGHKTCMGFLIQEYQVGNGDRVRRLTKMCQCDKKPGNPGGVVCQICTWIFPENVVAMTVMPEAAIRGVEVKSSKKK